VEFGMRNLSILDLGLWIAEWGKRAESLKLKAESRGQKTELGMRNGEGGIKRRWGDGERGEWGRWNWEFGRGNLSISARPGATASIY